MIRVGITGTLGAGKSTVGRLFREWGTVLGARRIDADALAREAVRAGTPGAERIREAWGEAVFTPDGEVDREALRRVVAVDEAARRRLEAIVHPEVLRLMSAREAEARAAGARVLVAEVPLLLEAGLEDAFDLVVTVDAPPALRRERTAASRGLSAEEFDALDAAQLSGAEKRARADRVIVNDGTPEELRARARAVWEEVAARAEAAGSGTTGSGATGRGGASWASEAP